MGKYKKKTQKLHRDYKFLFYRATFWGSAGYYLQGTCCSEVVLVKNALITKKYIIIAICIFVILCGVGFGVRAVIVSNITEPAIAEPDIAEPDVAEPPDMWICPTAVGLMLEADCYRENSDIIYEREGLQTDEQVCFDIETTIAVLQSVLEEEILTEESRIIRRMKNWGVPGAVRADWIDSPAGRIQRYRLEIESEDGTIYHFQLFYRTDANGTTYYVWSILNIDIGSQYFDLWALPREDSVEFRTTWIRD